MKRDYARRSAPARRPAAKKSTGRASRSKAGSRSSTTWSAPSFSAGVIFGAVLVLLASYAPTVFEDTVVAVREQVAPGEAEQTQIQFEFADILENDTVEVDTSVYPAEFPEEDPNAARYMIQAISLRSYDAASSLSSDLNGAGLNARFERVDINSVTWYRIMVGPFSNRREANRAMTELRERNMSPRLNKLG